MLTMKDNDRSMCTDELIGKTIKDIAVDGYGINIVTTDGINFIYNASDGGYSSWCVEKEEDIDANNGR